MVESERVERAERSTSGEKRKFVDPGRGTDSSRSVARPMPPQTITPPDDATAAKSAESYSRGGADSAVRPDKGEGREEAWSIRSKYKFVRGCFACTLRMRIVIARLIIMIRTYNTVQLTVKINYTTLISYEPAVPLCYYNVAFPQKLHNSLTKCVFVTLELKSPTQWSPMRN